MEISVETAQVRALAEATRAARAEARAALDAPHLLRGSMTAMAPGGLGGLPGAAARFLDAWQQALDDAAYGLERFGAALEVTALLYETADRVATVRTTPVTGRVPPPLVEP